MRTKKVQKSRQTFQSVENSVGICADGHVSDMRALRDVREIPMGYCPSVNPSVKVAQSRKFFSTLCEIPTGYCLSVYPLVKP